MRLSRTQDIQAFARVAQLGSFSAAARSLGLAASTVTKNVSRLEAELGVQLLLRTTHTVQTTDAGQRYLEHAERILVEIELAATEVTTAQEQTSGTVRISMPHAFARRTVVPSLHDFYAANPGIHLEISVKSATANPLEDGMDLSVHVGRLPDSGRRTRVLVRGAEKTVASPHYLERHGRPEVPEDLLAHQCIIGAFNPNWNFRAPDGLSRHVRVSGALRADSGDILVEAAEAGLGISHATWWLFRESLAAGRLVPVLEDYDPESEPISIVLPESRHVPSRIRTVVTFLAGLARS